MSDIICINEESIENDATVISGATSCFVSDTLIPIDERTTLTANTAGQLAFTNSQQIMETLGQNLEREVINIRSIGATFVEYDTMMAELLNSENKYSIENAKK